MVMMLCLMVMVSSTESRTVSYIYIREIHSGLVCKYITLL